MNLKELRRMANLTQFQLAQRCGVSRMRLSLAECEQLQLRPDEDRAVRNVLLHVIESRAAQLQIRILHQHDVAGSLRKSPPQRRAFSLILRLEKNPKLAHVHRIATVMRGSPALAFLLRSHHALEVLPRSIR